MSNEHEEAVAAFLRVFDERLSAAPLVERRQQPAAETSDVIEARRARGPIGRDFAYWDSRED